MQSHRPPWLPFSLSHVSAGFVAVLIGYTSSAVIIFQAADSAGASNAQISSWLWALGIGMAFTSIGLSLFYKVPVLTAWSTPGAALLITSLSGLTINEAVGAFMLSSALIMICGLAGWFDQLMRLIPTQLASAMLAGILFAFGLDVFIAMNTNLALVGAMLLCYLAIKTVLPRYVILITLCLGIAIALLQENLSFSTFELRLTEPVWVAPHFSFTAAIGVALPLFIVTMASQNIPGYAALRANGYEVPPSPLMAWTGLTGILFSPFGGFAYNLAAISAAICMTSDVDKDPTKRYMASVWAGFFYFITGLFGATVVSLFLIFPKELVMAIAGLALLNTIGNSLSMALKDEGSREPALLTFLITASGMTLFSIGSAFWGLLIGLLVTYWFRLRQAKV